MIKLDDNYILDADNTCFTLYKKKMTLTGKNAGEVSNVAVSYHGSVTQALKAWSKMLILDCVRNKNGDIDELITTINFICGNLEKKIEEITRGM